MERDRNAHGSSVDFAERDGEIFRGSPSHWLRMVDKRFRRVEKITEDRTSDSLRGGRGSLNLESSHLVADLTLFGKHWLSGNVLVLCLCSPPTLTS